MSNLRQQSEDYLAVRRSLGFKLVGEASLLGNFVSFLEDADIDVITTDLAVAWTRLATSAGSSYLARRMRVVRSFARYVQSLDPRTQVPPDDLFRSQNHRPTPYIYSDAEVVALMNAARELRPALRAATIETLIGLLAATGLRIGEALALDHNDIEFLNSVLIVRNAKFGKSREVLLHSSTLAALQTYIDRRDELCKRKATSSVFISTRGTRLLHVTVYPAFRILLRQTGLWRSESASQSRLHDLRHTFAVNCLLGWYRDGGDVAARLPLLSTYLGHVDPAATYWYLSGVPELLNLAVKRLENNTGARS